MPPHMPGRGVVGHYFDRCITVESGEGYTAFLGPPNVTCLKPECCNAPLRKHNEVCKATLFDIATCMGFQ